MTIAASATRMRKLNRRHAAVTDVIDDLT